MTISLSKGFGQREGIRGSWKYTYEEQVSNSRITGDADIMFKPQWMVSPLAENGMAISEWGVFSPTINTPI